MPTDAAAGPTVAPGQLFARTVELVDIASVSFEEAPLVAHLEGLLRGVAHLTVDRVGDNVIARTQLGRRQRLVLAGHTDTVPIADNHPSRREGDTLWGVGTADMKAGLAVMVELALAWTEPAVDVSYVFYAREEVAGRYSGLEEVFVARPELLAGDAAILGEPTSGLVEAGCQGTLRAKVSLAGARAHTARPWMGRNAIHRLAPILGALGRYEERRPIVAGLEFREALQAVAVEGGVAGNVVPDVSSLVINHRFAPDRSAEAALESVRELLAPYLEAEDAFELVECSPAAEPGIVHPLLARLAALSGGPVQPKLGWTDVARFASRGIPAVNFGPGDPTLAHRADERIELGPIVATYTALDDLLRRGA